VADPDDLDRAVALLSPLGAEPPRVERPTRSITVPVEQGSARLLEAVRALDAQRVAVSDIGLRRATLDEVFLSMTGRPAEEKPDTETGDPAATNPTTTDRRRRRRGAAA